MVRKMARLMVGSVACLFALGLSLGLVAAEDKPVSISEIMKKGHSGKKSYLAVIKEGVKGEKWDDVTKAAKELKKLGEDLTKNKPGKGEEDSWKKLSEAYKKNTADVFAAAEKKDAKAANEALTKIGGSCKSCHDNHK